MNFEAIMSIAGYARLKGTEIIGDIDGYSDSSVYGTLYDGSQFEWSFGNGEVDLIEFGSFNSKNKNYLQGGNVLAVL